MADEIQNTSLVAPVLKLYDKNNIFLTQFDLNKDREMSWREKRKFNKFWKSQDRINAENAFNTNARNAYMTDFGNYASQIIKNIRAANSQESQTSVTSSESSESSESNTSTGASGASGASTLDVLDIADNASNVTSKTEVNPVTTKLTTTPITREQLLNTNYFRPHHGFQKTVVIDGIQYPVVVTKGLNENNEYGLKNDQSYAIDTNTGMIRELSEDLFGALSGGWADKNGNWLTINPKLFQTTPITSSSVLEASGKVTGLSPIVGRTQFQKQGGSVKLIKKHQRGGSAENTYFLNKNGESIPATIKINSDQPSDTTLILTPDINRATRRIHLNGPNSTVEIFNGDQGFIPDTENSKYWIDKARESYYNRPSKIFEYWKNTIKKIKNNKQGGTMRTKYFQQGGAAPQQDMQQQVIALVQAAMQGDQKATETVNKIMEAAKAGDQQAMQIAQMIQAVAEQMQGQATAAKWGAKLNYIRSLKYAKGGKTCPTCNQKIEMKACGGKKAKKKYFGGWL